MAHLISAGLIMIFKQNYVGGICSCALGLFALEYSEYEKNWDKIGDGWHATLFGFNLSRNYITSRWWTRGVYILLGPVLCLSDERFNKLMIYIYLANIFPLIYQAIINEKADCGHVFKIRVLYLYTGMLIDALVDGKFMACSNWYRLPIENLTVEWRNIISAIIIAVAWIIFYCIDKHRKHN